jgi:hypothetical protein
MSFRLLYSTSLVKKSIEFLLKFYNRKTIELRDWAWRTIFLFEDPKWIHMVAVIPLTGEFLKF